MSESEDATSFAVFGSIMSVLMIASVAGNIVCFRLTRRMVRSKPSLVLVLNLNASDILVSLFTWTAFMTQHISTQTKTEIDLVVHKIFWSAIITLGNMTILTLSGLAADCFIALRWPLHYKDISTIRAIRIYIGVSWVLSTLFGLGDFFLAASNYEHSYKEAVRDTMVFSSTKYDTLGSKLTASLTMLLSNSISVLCLCTLVVIYSYILIKINRIKRNKTLSKQGGFRSEIHAVRTTLMVFTSFLLLFAPTLAVNMVTVVQPNFLSKLSLIEASFIGYTADCLLLVHSMVDAVIYGVRVTKTINRQRRSRLTLQDYIKHKRRGSSYSSSVSSYSLSPSRQRNGITSLAQSCVVSVGQVSLTATSNTKRGSKLQTISELCENQVSETNISEVDSMAEQSSNAERQQTTATDIDSIDEGIGTHSESGSDEHDMKHPDTPPSSTSEQSQRTDNTKLLPHRKAVYKRSKSLNHIDCGKPVMNLDLKEDRTISVLEGATNSAFISDHNSNQLTFIQDLQRERYASGGRHGRLTRLFSLCSCSTCDQSENKPSSPKTVLSCTRL